MARRRRRGLILSAAVLLAAGCAGSDDEPQDEATAAWAAEVNAICGSFAERVGGLGDAENFIVHSQQAREFGQVGRIAFAQIASVPRPPGREDEIREMVAAFTNAFDKYERYADALLDRDEALVEQLEEEIDDLLTDGQAAASDLGADCLAG